MGFTLYEYRISVLLRYENDFLDSFHRRVATVLYKVPLYCTEAGSSGGATDVFMSQMLTYFDVR